MTNDTNPLGDLAGNMSDGLKNQLGNKIDVQKMLSEQNLEKKRSAFWTCLIAALLLMVLALGAAVYYNANKVELFENALIKNVDPELSRALGLDEASLKDFARATIFYLNGAEDVWTPRIVVGGLAVSQFIPQSFRDHMATVKSWFSSATAVLLAGAGIALALLSRALIGRKGSKKSSFSLGGYYLGALVPLAVIGGISLWGILNFDNLWNLLHKALTPDGIFDVVAVPIMQLFPVGLFAAYLRPVAVAFSLLAAVVLVLPLILKPLSKPLTNLLGSSGRSSRGASRRGRTSNRIASNPSAVSKRATHRASDAPAAKKTTVKKTTAKKSASR